MTVKITNVNGYIVPISNGTKIRPEYSTYSLETIGSAFSGDRVDVDQIIERTVTDPDKPHNYVGDKWGRVIAINNKPVAQPCYMAIIYHNSSFAPVAICKEFYTPLTENPLPSTSDTEFPDFILVYGNINGQKVEKTYKEISSKIVG